MIAKAIKSVIREPGWVPHSARRLAAGVLREIVEFLELPEWDDPPALVRKYNSAEYEEMSPAVRAFLSNYYREPNRRLADRLGDDFHW